MFSKSFGSFNPNSHVFKVYIHICVIHSIQNLSDSKILGKETLFNTLFLSVEPKRQLKSRFIILQLLKSRLKYLSIFSKYSQKNILRNKQRMKS